MPTVVRIGKLRIVIYPADHRPAHVHVKGAGKEALFYLSCPDGPITLRSHYRFTLRELNRIEEQLTPHLEELCKAWKEIHDHY